jgi:ankyrin repeat protein
MKSQLIAIVAAVLLVGCGPSVDIHQAAKDGNIKAVKQHLADSVDVNAKGEYGLTPLHYAAGEGHKEVVELLITKGADVNTKADGGGTPLLWAASSGHKEIIELLIAEGADVNAGDKITPLHYAVQYGEMEIVELLIDAGADVNAQENSYSSETPLDYAKGKKEVADLLRKHGGKTGEELKTEEK